MTFIGHLYTYNPVLLDFRRKNSVMQQKSQYYKHIM